MLGAICRIAFIVFRLASRCSGIEQVRLVDFYRYRDTVGFDRGQETADEGC